jgi:cytoskeletal protein CcmA (bactofilin family)
MSFFGNRRQSDQPTTPQPTEESVPTPRPLPQPAPAQPSQPVGFDTVLGANCTFEGALHSNANVRLDGAFSGTLEIDGNVLVGETAKITADINAKNVSIAGAVRGNVYGKKVQLLRTGRIWGDIRAMALTTEEGAFIDGKITMIGHEEVVDQPLQEVVAETPQVDEVVYLSEAAQAEIGEEMPVQAVLLDTEDLYEDEETNRE